MTVFRVPLTRRQGVRVGGGGTSWGCVGRLWCLSARPCTRVHDRWAGRERGVTRCGRAYHATSAEVGDGIPTVVRLRLLLCFWGSTDMQLRTASVQDASRENNCRSARMRLSRPGRKTVLCCFLMAFPRPLRRPRWGSPNTKIHALPASRGVLPHQSVPTAGFGTLLQRPPSRALAAYWEHRSIRAQSAVAMAAHVFKSASEKRKTPSDCNMSLRR